MAAYGQKGQIQTAQSPSQKSSCHPKLFNLIFCNTFQTTNKPENVHSLQLSIIYLYYVFNPNHNKMCQSSPCPWTQLL